MKKIALTGGIACGKSLAGRYLARAGVPVCDADRLAHELMRKGEPVYEAVVREFGSSIVGADGEIDRIRLGRLVFGAAERRAILNGLTHPAVKRAIDDWFAGLPSEVPAAVAAVPLLYEAGMEKGWDGVITVACSPSLQLSRLMERGWTEADARLRVEAQWPQAEKMARSDWVILNNGTKEMLEEQVKAVLQRIVER